MSVGSDTENIGATEAFAEIVEERYALVVWLYLIKKETDKKIKQERKRGEKSRAYITLFALPCFIKKHFGVFLPTPLVNKAGQRYTLYEEDKKWFKKLIMGERGEFETDESWENRGKSRIEYNVLL